MDIYLEVGEKRVFAGALAWPGWCRMARDEEGAIDALVAYGPRYRAIIAAARIRPGFVAPKRAASLTVRERLAGDSTTDFGAPSIAPAVDGSPMKQTDLRRSQALLQAGWSALDRAAEAATGVELTRGPRGGGRELEGILAHVVGAESYYARRIAARPPAATDDARTSHA
ncbi:MAG: hypothetical protein QOI81_815, partial [Actinomycetota bacterium]|nr:hypothetical protein [Actinomycetota bacterium]